MFVNFHDRGLVTAAVAVVGRTEDGHHILILTPVVSLQLVYTRTMRGPRRPRMPYLHNQLMCTGDQRKAVVVVEVFRNVLTKSIAGASRRDSPARSVVWIGPEQITHGTFMRNFLDTIQGTNVVQ